MNESTTRVGVNITKEEVEEAIRGVRHKANGVDEMSSRVMKHEDTKDILVEKLTKKFNEWMEKGKLPKYFNQARLLVLSKTGEAFPEEG